LLIVARIRHVGGCQLDSMPGLALSTFASLVLGWKTLLGLPALPLPACSIESRVHPASPLGVANFNTCNSSIKIESAGIP
jgi:hypothetical protein